MPFWHSSISNKSHLGFTCGPPYSYLHLNSDRSLPRIYVLRVKIQFDDTDEPICIKFLTSKCPDNLLCCGTWWGLSCDTKAIPGTKGRSPRLSSSPGLWFRLFQSSTSHLLLSLLSLGLSERWTWENLQGPFQFHGWENVLSLGEEKLNKKT